MEIKEAVLQDIPEILKMGRKFWEFTRYKKLDDRPYSHETVRTLLHNLLENDMGFVLKIVDEDELVGFAIILEHPLIWDWNVKCAGELAYYMKPEARGAGIGTKLLKAVEDTAQERGCVYVAMISMDHSMDVGPFYEKHGYVSTEKTYTKLLKEAQ